MLRRDFLALTRYAAMAAVIPNDWRVRLRPRFQDQPFSLGVASGDPTPTSAVLWTRLAPRPLEAGYGMAGVRTAVGWEVAADEGFARVVRQGVATAAPELGHSIHVDVQGLEPDRWYFYRFQSGDARSPVGRTRTTPADGATTPLRFGVAGCQHYEAGLYTAYGHLAEEELDLLVHTGDYIYETSPQEGRVRRHANEEIRTVEDYRIRYAQYKSDPMLQAAHARYPWLVTWDDHEVDNNYAADVGENGMESAEQMRSRRAAGYQAWWENQPVRVPRARSWADLTIHRSVNWGGLARFWVLDTRQYRSDQSCGDGSRIVPCGEWADPTRTVLGAAQEEWVVDGLADSRARWQVLAQQIMMAPFDAAAGNDRQVSMDQWSGYPVARDRLLGAVARHAPNRTVVLTGDIHSSWVNELSGGLEGPRGGPVAAEFVGTSIASGGDGVDQAPNVTRQLGENPHLKWQNGRRGYLRCRVTPDDWTSDYRVVPFVTRPGAPVETATSWRLERGQPGIERV